MDELANSNSTVLTQDNTCGIHTNGIAHSSPERSSITNGISHKSEKLIASDHGQIGTKNHISRGLLISYIIGILIFSGSLYVESMKKPDELPQRLKVTMIDKMSLTVLQTAQLVDDLGFAHELNVTRGFFERATSLLGLLDGSPLTHILVGTIGGVKTSIETVCDILNLDFCRPVSDDEFGELGMGDSVEAVDDVFDGVPVRLYRPHPVSEVNNQPAIIYVHGAVVMGTIDVWDALIRMYSANTNATIVYVEYRWAPEHGFPAPLEDCLTVTRHVLRNAHNYHIDPANVAIQGDSAGGVIAAVVAQTIAEEYHQNTTNQKLKMLVLMMPLLQGLDLNLPSHQNNAEFFSGILSKVLVAKFWIWYMGLDGDDLVKAIIQGKHLPEDFKRSDRYQKVIGHDLLPEVFRSFDNSPSIDEMDDIVNFDVNSTNIVNLNVNTTESNDIDPIVEKLSPYFLNPKFSPFMEENISPYHPLTLVVTTGYDILRDDGIMYANKLRRAGVKVWWRHFEKGFHSCIAYWQGMMKVEIGQQVLKETIAPIRTFLNEPENRFYS